MAWELVESCASPHGELELYTQDMQHFMIRFDGIELMNGMLHSSEDVLGELAVALCKREGSRILIGGLGLGFTLAAALRAQAPNQISPQIKVAELTSTVIDWFERYFRHSLQLPANCAEIIAGDAYQIIAERGPWSVICLDIDNGPSYLSTSANQKMYAAAGLQQISLQLEADGACLVWSANQEADLIENSHQAGFHIYLRVVHTPMAARVFEQYVYVLSKRALDLTFCTQFALQAMWPQA